MSDTSVSHGPAQELNVSGRSMSTSRLDLSTILAIIGTGVALAALIIGLNSGLERSLKDDIKSAKDDLYKYIDKAEANLISRQDDFIDVQNRMDEKISGLVTSVEVTSALLEDHRQQHSPTLASDSRSGSVGSQGTVQTEGDLPFSSDVLQNTNKPNLGFDLKTPGSGSLGITE